MTQELPQSLSELLAKHDDQVVLKNPISIRMPAHIMAKVMALSDVFDDKSRSEMILFLLKVSLEMLETQTFAESNDPTKDELGALIGDVYRKSANKYHRELLTELGKKHFADLFPVKGEAE